ncbi:hypothetical protein COCNU_06G004130 [Cocos nucifera]|uniref:Uncharacterized protein n=1 Tax=Cocos nucifera TaxID=13894 RepID=A0A8K0N2N0_COCNU|nr:hypothetical protein COCNU_06G004130 [Cocos nucifera]
MALLVSLHHLNIIELIFSNAPPAPPHSTASSMASSTSNLQLSSNSPFATKLATSGLCPSPGSSPSNWCKVKREHGEGAKGDDAKLTETIKIIVSPEENIVEKKPTGGALNGEMSELTSGKVKKDGMGNAVAIREGTINGVAAMALEEGEESGGIEDEKKREEEGIEDGEDNGILYKRRKG